MQKIYVITAGIYSDYRIITVFTDKEKAEKWVKEYNKVNSQSWEEIDIEVYEDESYKELDFFYFIPFDYDLDIDEEEIRFEKYLAEEKTIFTTFCHYVICKADTLEKAIKVATERISQAKYDYLKGLNNSEK